MTKQRSWLAGVWLAAVLMLGVPRDAFAVVGWIEKLSGPGEFLVVSESFDRLLCAVRGSDGNPQVGRIRGPSSADTLCKLDGGDDPTNIRAYVSVELSWARNLFDEEFRYDTVTMWGIRPIVFLRVQESLDLGVGLGFTRFSGDTGFGFTRATVPLRARIYMPWLKRNSGARPFYIALTADYFSGSFSYNDFRQGPEDYREETELVKGVSVHLDIIQALRRW